MRGRLLGRPALRAAIASFLVTRGIVVAAAVLGTSRLPRLYHGGPFTELALGWDGAWYAGIAKDGYFIPPPPAGSNLAFPPLLPLLAHLLGGVFGAAGLGADDPAYGNWALAGILISNLAFFGALYLLWHLVALDHSAGVATRTLWLLAAFPAGIFWSAFYTESLYLVLAVGCVLAARRAAWPVAGMLGGLAILARWPAVVLIAVLLVEWIAARRQAARAAPPGAAAWPALQNAGGWAGAWIGLLPLTLAGYAAYLQVAFGNAWIVLQARAQWGQSWSFFPWTYIQGGALLWQSLTRTGADRDVVAQVGSGNTLYMWLDLGLPLVFAGLGVLGWRRGWLRQGDGALLALGLLFPLSTGSTFGLTRYVLPLWPAYIVIARLGERRPALARAWLYTSGVLLAVLAYLFGNEQWIG